MAANAILQYREKKVVLKPGHSAVLKCYKKKMQGTVIVSAEPNEDGSIVPDGTITIDTPGVHDVSLFKDADVQVIPDEDVEITPTEEVQTVDYDPTKKGIQKVTVSAIQIEEIDPIAENKVVKAPDGKYFKEVVVSVPAGATVSGTYDVDKNGIYDVTNFANAMVNVIPDEEVNITPGEEARTLYYDPTKKGISKVNVSAIQAGGLEIDEKKVSFIPLERRFSGSFAPNAGSYYKNVDLSIPLPDGYIKPENVERELVKNNTLYDVTRDKAVTVRLPLQSVSVNPSESQKTVVCSGKDASGNDYQGLKQVVVNPISVYTPPKVTSPKATVTAPEGQYIKEVTVDVPTITVHSGSGAPSSSLGNNGDIYLELE